MTSTDLRFEVGSRGEVNPSDDDHDDD